MDDDFEILAAKVLSGEATPEEVARLQERLAGNTDLQAEFAELHATWAVVKEVGPLAGALDAPPSAPPPQRLKSWQAAVARKSGVRPDAASTSAECKPGGISFTEFDNWVRRSLGESWIRWALATVGVAVVVVVGIQLWQGRSDAGTGAYLVIHGGAVDVIRDGKPIPFTRVTPLRDSDKIRLQAQASATLITPIGAQTLAANRLSSVNVPTHNKQTNAKIGHLPKALFQSTEQLRGLLVTTRSRQGISVYSPVGFTASLTPNLIWKSESGKTYDVVITDEFTPGTPLRCTAVVPPVEFTNAWPGRSLAKDRLYRMRVSETGKPFTATERTIHTLPEADVTLPADADQRLLTAYRLLATDSGLIGDALAILLTLPEDLADSELAQRLKLFAFGQMGYKDDFDAALIRIEAGK